MRIFCTLTIFLVSLLTACTSDKPSNQWTTVSSSPDQPTPSATKQNAEKAGFASNLPEGFTNPTDEAAKGLLKEYGAVFVARGGAISPKVVVFPNDAAVTAFQSSAPTSTETVGGVSITLQNPAMKGLQSAIAEASQSGKTITPRGADAAKRSYAGTVELWASRVKPGLDHYVGLGRMTAADATRISGLSPYEQVPEIFKLESQGMYFSKDLSKSIIYSVAPPGSSQHLSMLALDVTENENSDVRKILAKHGWFQTVLSDLPHFTFLGVAESELPGLGLKKSSNGGRVFWTPDI